MFLADEKIEEQNGFNGTVRRQLGPSFDADHEVFWCFDGFMKEARHKIRLDEVHALQHM